MLLPTRFAQRNLRSSLNGNCVLLPTRFAQRKLRASLNGNCVLHPTEIVCFAQRSSLNGNYVFRPTQTLSFVQRNIQCNNFFFSSYSYKRISFFTVTIVWTVLHVCHCCHYMSLIIGTAHAMSRESVDSIRWDATRPFSQIEWLRTPKRSNYKTFRHIHIL